MVNTLVKQISVKVIHELMYTKLLLYYFFYIYFLIYYSFYSYVESAFYTVSINFYFSDFFN